MANPPVATIAQQPQLYGSSGKPLDLTPTEAQTALTDGKAGFLKTDTVHLVTPQGQVRKFTGAEASQVIQAGGRLATDAEVHHAQVEARYGGVAGQAMTDVLGAASGASLGVSDAAISALGGRQYLQEHVEANPLSFAGSQMLGSALPMLIPGGEAAAGAEIAEGAQAFEGASALARAAETAKTGASVLSAPTRAVGRLGQGIESAVHEALGVGAGEGGSVITGLAKKALAKGAGAVAEGAALGGAQEIDEHVIEGDPEINGEKLLAAMGHGALLGLGTAGALTAAGEIGSSVLGRASPALGKMAETEAFRTINARKAFTNAADKIPGGVEGVGRELLDKGLVGFGDRVEDIAPKIAEARQEAGAKIGQILDRADEAGFEGPRVNDVRAQIQKDVLPELEKLGGTNAGAIAKVRTLMDDLDHFAGIPRVEDLHSISDANAYADKLANARLTFRQAQEFRARLDDAIKWTTNPLAPVNEATVALKKVRGILETELENAGEKAANKLGGTFKDEYKAAKLSYRRLIVADQAAQDAVERSEANRRISLTDYLGGDIATHAFRAIGGGAVGAATGEEGGGGEGGMLGGLATGALGALAHHAIRTRGNSSAAVLLDKLSALRGIERAAVHIDNQIDRGVGGFFREEGRIPVKLREPIEGAKGEHAAETAHRAYREATANPDAHMANVARAAAPVAPHAPLTANSFQRAALRATMYLSQVAPKSQTKPSITPQFDKPRLSEAQRSDYMRTVTAVHDPVSVLKDMELGRVTRAQVDAIKIVYPALYQDIVDRVHERLADLKHPLTYEQKIQISTLLGVPSDATMSPEFVRAMQASYAGGTPPGQGPSPHKHAGRQGTQRPIKDNLSADVKLAMGQGKE